MHYLRLKKNGDFQKLFKRGKRVFSSNLTIIYSPCKERTVMGIALSKKHGKAVKRNRIKRLIRAAFNDSFSYLNGNYNMVIMPKVEKEYSYKGFCKNLVSCFGRMEK